MPDHRPCPICGGVARRALHRQRFLDGPLGDGYDVVVCTTCGAGFADGIPSQAELDAYYAERSKYTYDQSGGAESPYDFQRFERIADQVVPFLPSPAARILDVGCATGGLLAVLKRRGFTNVLGADPSPACAAAARRLHGVEVRVAALQQLAGWTDRFDQILLVGVLEHLREVGPAVETVRQLLTQGGMVYCAQPDVAAFADCVNAPYQQFSLEHVNFFSETSLNRLMGRYGLASLRIWHWLVEWREGVSDSVVSGVYAPLAAPAGSRSSVPEDRSAAGETGMAIVPQLPGSSSLPPPPPALIAPSLSIDRESEPALERYLARCRGEDATLHAAIERLVQSREPVLVWGAGTLTRRLLATTRLSEANITAFVDANPAIQGQQLAGRTVLDPSAIVNQRVPIAVLSKAFEREIVTVIRQKLRLTNRIITF